MKKIVLLVFLTFSANFYAQNEEILSKSAENDTVVQVIKDFFKAFHQQDTTALRNFVTSDVEMRSIALDTAKNAEISGMAYGNFLKGIKGIPKSTNFEERLEAIAVHNEGNLASVLTPYTFYRNRKVSHCGVNSFLLLKNNGKWKIISITDTRKQKCLDPKK